MKNIYIAILLLMFALTCNAQVFKICNGINADGERTYIDVYEYDYVSEKPTFPGGDSKLINFINQNREYPRQAYNAGIQGRVVCSFIVNTNGTVSNVMVMRGVEPTLNAEAVRLISMMPKWTPGRIDGNPVPVRVIYPIPFRK